MKRLTVQNPLLAGGALAATGGVIAAILIINHRPENEAALKPINVNYTASSPNPAKSAASSSHPVDSAYYSRAIRGNLFSAPVPPPVREPSPNPAHVKVVVPHIPPPDPLADSVYAGSVTKVGKTAALIQSRSTNAGQYIVSGAHLDGFTVSSVTPREVQLTRNGAHRTLERSDTVNVVQLSASAPQPVTPAAATGPLVQPGAQAANAAAMAAARSYQAALRSQQRSMQRQQRNEQRALRSMYQQYFSRGRQNFGR